MVHIRAEMKLLIRVYVPLLCLLISSNTFNQFLRRRLQQTPYKAVCVFRGLNRFAVLYEEVCEILGNTLTNSLLFSKTGGSQLIQEKGKQRGLSV